MKHGDKFDIGKLRYDLIPVIPLEKIVRVLTKGVKKYGARNWEIGTDWSKYYAALQRHLKDWWDGKDTDADTGLSPLAHAGCDLMFLLEYVLRHTGTDDRPYHKKGE